MKLKPLFSIVALSLAISAQARPVATANQAQPKQNSISAARAGLVHARENAKNAMAKLKGAAGFNRQGKGPDTKVRGANAAEQNFSVNVPHPVISTEINSPF